MEDYKVSICVITYNHEQYIEETIKGILIQQVDFNYEIVIGYDQCKDKTLEICLRYRSLYPDLIRVLVRPNRLGMMGNFKSTLEECKGDYIAICEGDDYWIDRNKLQRQVNFLNHNGDYQLCFHNAQILFSSSGETAIFNKGLVQEATFETLLKEWTIPTASVVFRNPKTSYPDYFLKATHGDLGLFLFLNHLGKFHYIDFIGSVYRKHEDGIMNSFMGLQHNMDHIAFCGEMNIYFKFKYQKFFNERISNYYLSNSKFYVRSGQRIIALKYAFKAFNVNKRLFFSMCLIFLIACLPFNYKFLSRLK